MWTDMQSKNSYCTAERIAINNFSLGYLAPDTSLRKNAYRKWIGVQT